MIFRTIALLALLAGLAVLVFTYGHKRGRASRRSDHRDGYLEGVRAEAARWEKVTGVGFARLQAWRTGRGPDPFANLAAETEVLPSAEVLLAEADVVLSSAEVEEWKARWEAAQSRAPVVADITSAARCRPPGTGEVPVVTGRVVTPGRDPGGADWDVLAGQAFPDYVYAPDALGGHRTVDELVDSIVMRAVRFP